MKKIMVVGLCVAVSACAWFKANEATVSTDASKLALCEVEYLVSSPAPTPAGAVQACAGLLISDAVQLFGTLEGGVTDAGVPTSISLKIKGARK